MNGTISMIKRHLSGKLKTKFLQKKKVPPEKMFDLKKYKIFLQKLNAHDFQASPSNSDTFAVI